MVPPPETQSAHAVGFSATILSVCEAPAIETIKAAQRYAIAGEGHAPADWCAASPCTGPAFPQSPSEWAATTYFRALPRFPSVVRMRVWFVLLIGLIPTAAALAPIVDGPILDEDALLPLVAPASNAPWAREVVANLPRATAINDADGDKVWDDLEQRFVTSPLQALGVVVTFTSGTETADGLAAARAAVPTLEPVHEFHIVPGFSAHLTLHDVHRIAALDVVRQVEYDDPAVPELETATAMFGADFVVDGAGFTGDQDGNEATYTTDDVVIAILDTGFDGQHVDLAGGKIVHFEDFADDPQAEPYDDGGHGSHVAGIAAGPGAGDARYRGVAPGAAILGLKIVGSQDTEATTIKAYEWLVENKERFGVDIATISFGFGFTTDGTSALELAIDKVWEAGIVCFKSNGNSGPGAGTTTVPGGARGIISVGSMLDAAAGPEPVGITATAPALGDAGFLLSSYSSRGPTTDGRIKPDLVAPGQSIMSIDAGTTDGYVSLSGTSMAAPFAAGTAALMLDANPALAPDEVRELMQATAEDWGAEGPDIDYGAGRIQVDRAVEAALEHAGHNATLSVPIHPFHIAHAGDLAAPFSEFSIDVNDTTHPFAVTTIVEGALVQLTILDPEMTPIASLDAPTVRQHQLGFNAETTGTYTVRLVGEPGAAWVADVSHGVVPEGVAVPSFSGILESASEAPEGVDENAPAASLVLAVVALAVAALLAVRRR